MPSWTRRSPPSKGPPETEGSPAPTRQPRLEQFRRLRDAERPDASGRRQPVRRDRIHAADGGREAHGLRHRIRNAPAALGRRPGPGARGRGFAGGHRRDSDRRRRGPADRRRPPDALRDLRWDGVDSRVQRTGPPAARRRHADQLPAWLLPDEREVGRRVPFHHGEGEPAGCHPRVPARLQRPRGVTRVRPPRVRHPLPHGGSAGLPR